MTSMVRRIVSITKNQDKYLKEHKSINFAGLIRQLLREKYDVF